MFLLSAVYKRRLMQRRWKSLRDCFTRELSRMKKLKSSALLADYKPYCYFKHLAFLLDAVEHTSQNVSIQSQQPNNAEVKDINENDKTVSDIDKSSNECSSINEMEEYEISENNIDKNINITNNQVKNISASKVLKVIKTSRITYNNINESDVKQIPSSLIKVLPIKFIPSQKLNNDMIGFKEKIGCSSFKVLSSNNIKLHSVNDKNERVLSSTEDKTVFHSQKNEDSSNSSDKDDTLKDCTSKDSNILRKTSRVCSEYRSKKIPQTCKIRKRNLLQKIKSKKQNKKITDDEDRLFLLSLIKELKKVPEDYKLDVKLEIMKALKRGQNKEKCKFNNFISEDVMMYDYQTPNIGANVTISSCTKSPEEIISENSELNNEAWSLYLNEEEDDDVVNRKSSTDISES
ncbi:uncharacterized protein LOC142320630 isoform X2 [Lycorma delicatula]|uniref:uncharacterized protein LOC142320630 isoform X2 n=1 Tax=Lycorma delicatula TaxID=130591 RepID=UPI003F518C7A